MQETPCRSVLEGLVDGVCIMLIFALRKKSAEPPKPFNILEPMISGVGVGIYIDFDWSVHTNNAQASNDLRRVGHLLGSQQQLPSIILPAVVESLESIWGESNRCCSRKVQMTTVKEI